MRTKEQALAMARQLVAETGLRAEVRESIGGGYIVSGVLDIPGKKWKPEVHSGSRADHWFGCGPSDYVHHVHCVSPQEVLKGIRAKAQSIRDDAQAVIDAIDALPESNETCGYGYNEIMKYVREGD